MTKPRVHRWEDTKKKLFTKEQIAAAQKYAEEEILRLNLAEVRKLRGLTQVQLAKATKMAQPELSRVERRDDHMLSTLRRYIEALGGEVEVVARFDGKTVRLVGV
jgi:DNA-binding XRE family transcriptional regulator